MNNQLEEIVYKNLGDFFKHCLNVAGDIRKIENYNGPLWIGWMRCKIDPFLKNNKLETDNPEEFKEKLLYTIQDYLEYCEIFKLINIKNILKIQQIQQSLQLSEPEEIIEKINGYYYYFPDESDTLHFYVLIENFNNRVKLGRKYKHNLKP